MFNIVNEDELRYYLSAPINTLSKIEQAKRPLVVALYNAKQDYSSIGLKAFDKVDDIGEGFKVGVDVLNPYYKYIIKPDGTLINEVFHYVDKFSEGTCQVSYSRAIRKDPYIETCHNHIDTNGNFCFGHNQFIYIGGFVEGVANACIEPGKWNYIDKNGTVLFPQYCFSHSFGFENGWGEVTKDYKVRNYINKDGVFKFSEWFIKNK